MPSKIEKLVYSASLLDCLQCTKCGKKLVFSAGGFVCENGHMFNPNRKGYVNFLPSPVSSCYDEKLFAARSHVFHQGLYLPVLEAIRTFIGKGRKVLDAGCGEGWYTASIASNDPDSLCCGIDISRDAITQAACHEENILWCVGDLKRLPFSQGSFDAVLDILTPANYGEFARVLGGDDPLLIKVYPGGDYLREIRTARGMRLYDEGNVGEYLAEHAEICEERHIHFTQPVSAGTWRALVYMTPLNQDLPEKEKEKLAEKPDNEITLDLHVAACRNCHS